MVSLEVHSPLSKPYAESGQLSMMYSVDGCSKKTMENLRKYAYLYGKDRNLPPQICLYLLEFLTGIYYIKSNNAVLAVHTMFVAINK